MEQTRTQNLLAKWGLTKIGQEKDELELGHTIVAFGKT